MISKFEATHETGPSNLFFFFVFIYRTDRHALWVWHVQIFCVAEIEAKEACDWLRAAGFPQYAQLFEGNTSPHEKLLLNLTNVITPNCTFVVHWYSHSDFEANVWHQHHLAQTQAFNVGFSFRCSCGRLVLMAARPDDVKLVLAHSFFLWWDVDLFHITSNVSLLTPPSEIFIWNAER